ncbi:MAG TPA: MFS transporter, partial [Ruminiclostridium sp.]|nr:MFS transporter [Ruminiclostridium sp.]
MEKNKSDKLWTKDFLLIWQGQLVSLLGDAAYSVALGFWVLQVTGSTVLMGTLMAASTLPGVLVSPFAGVWLDRLNRKPLLIFMDILRGAAMLLVAIAAYTHYIQIWMVFAAGILLSICGAFFTPGVNSAIPDVVSRDKLSNANSTISAATTGSNMLGNIAGGFLFQALGAPLLFLFDSLSFFFSGGSLCFVKLKKSQNISQKDFFGDMKEGFRYVRNNKGLRNILLLGAIGNFFAFVGIVDFLPLFQRTPNLGAGLYGVAMASYMGGAMIGYMLFSVIKIPADKRLVVTVAANTVSCITVAVGINLNNFAVMVPFIILSGLFNAVVNVVLMTAVQATTSESMRGKTLSLLNMITSGLTPIAMALGGVLASVLPIRLIIS